MITHNGRAHLADQLASIAAQSRLPDELVISDDASSDGTVALCHDFTRRAPFVVRVLVSDAPIGASQNRSKAISACTGSVIALADQDDVWHREKLERTVQALTANGPALAFCDAEIVDEHRQPMGIGLFETNGFNEDRRSRVEHGRAFTELLERNFVAGPATAFRATLKGLALPIPDGVRADAWLALIAAATSGIVLVPGRLFEYRQSPGQQIGAGLGWSSRARRRLVNSIPLQLRARFQTGSPFDATLGRLEPLRARLLVLDRSEHPPGPGCLEAVDDRIAHWRFRANLPKRRRPRGSAIRAELATGRYHRYGRGSRSALADLVYPVPPPSDQ